MGAAGAPIKAARAWWRRDEARNLLREIKVELDDRWGDDPVLSDAYEQVAHLVMRPEVAEAFDAAVVGDVDALDRVREYLSEHVGSDSSGSSREVAAIV